MGNLAGTVEPKQEKAVPRLLHACIDHAETVRGKIADLASSLDLGLRPPPPEAAPPSPPRDPETMKCEYEQRLEGLVSILLASIDALGDIKSRLEV